MTDRAGHRRLREQLGWYALGHGTPEERGAVRAHLDGCPACRDELTALTPLTARLSGVDPDRVDERPSPPHGLGDAVLARVAAERAAAAPVWPRHRARALAAVAAVGVAAAGFTAGWLLRPTPAPLPLEPVAVEVTEDGVAASAQLVPHTWGVEVKLSGQGFTAGAVYSVVVEEADGDRVPAGSFLGVGPGSLDCNLNSSVLREDAAGFEVRDEAGALVLRSAF